MIKLRFRRADRAVGEVLPKVDSSFDEVEDASESVGRAVNWPRVVVYGVLPGLALTLAMAAGFLKWQDSSIRDSDRAAAESLQAAKDSIVALLSYKPDTVEHDLKAARDRLTGNFRDAYTGLTNDVVIPGAKQKQISVAVRIPAATSVSADGNHAVALVYVNQTVTMGKDAPTDSVSSVRVTLEKTGDRWLISGLDPV
jgi:Mce-associated membrane protein